MPGEMRAVVCSGVIFAEEAFTPEALTVKTCPVPSFKDDEVLIKVAASSVNPVDWKILSGKIGPVQAGIVPGFDCSGVVVAVGAAVTRFKVGDEVWADVVERPEGVLKLGAYAEYVATKENKTGLKPTNLPFDQAAVVPLVGLTALQGLQKGDVLKEGAHVLILGGSGGNGICAIQIAKASGATVYTTCSGKNMDFVKSLGADQVIDYTKDDWAVVLKGKNLDCVFDTVGQDGTVPKAVDVLKDNGTIKAIMGGTKESLPRGITFEFYLTNSVNFADLDTLKTLVESGKMRLPVQESFPLDRIADAFKLSMSGRVVGKVGISVSSIMPAVLYYFPAGGRGELARCIAAAGGIGLIEGKPADVDKADFASPSGVPLLKHGALKMAQSTAIEVYLSLLAFPDLTPPMRAVDSQLCSTKEDVIAGFYKVFFNAEMKENKEKAKEELAKVASKWYPVIDKQCPTDGFFNGQGYPTAADVAVMNICDCAWAFGVANRIAGVDWANYPKMRALATRTAEFAAMKEYLAKSATFAANPMGL